MSDRNFYRAFEDAHRGSRALIKSRLTVYFPFLRPLLSLYPHAEALDLGCGRGEWLELLTEQGFAARGVDLDEGMLAACHELGLSVSIQDVIAALESCADESLAVVSAFHVVEHIPFETLQALVREALRVLKPAGLLILETPNPENITVGTANFYVDPTHQRPIPIPLLSFLPENDGYYRTKVLRLQEPEALRNSIDISLMDVLGGVSPDFSVVAQKQGRRSDLSLFDAEFDQEFGLNLSNLATRYDSSLSRRFDVLEALVQVATLKANNAESKAIKAESKAIKAESKAIEAESKAVEAGAKAQQAYAELHLAYNSRSWRITKPLRWGAIQLRRLRDEGLICRIKALAKKVLRSFFSIIRSKPFLYKKMVGIAYRFGFYDNVRALYFRAFSTNSSVPPIPREETNDVSDDMTPQAQKIYTDLKAAIANHQKDAH